MDAPREDDADERSLDERALRERAAEERAIAASLVPISAVLAPPATRGHVSVARMAAHWFIVAQSHDLEGGPTATTLMGMPLVLFRDGDGKAGALLDRCPHRNVPLSLGAIEQGQLQCAYHGWRFDRGGACRFIPSLCLDGLDGRESREAEGKGRRAVAFPVVEQDGFVWVYATPSAEPGQMPDSLPYKFPHADARGYTTTRDVVYAESTMHAAIENALDVPHTAFLHKGLFRSKSRGVEITAVVKRGVDSVEAEYVGEPRPPGLVARILSPSGGTVTHFDRFILPSIAQVEYRIGTESHFLVTSAMTPVTDFFTRIYAVVSFKLRLIPGWLVKPFLRPLALRIFQQDAAILRMQTENIRRFGGEQFVSTEIDVLGRHIWRLMKSAERGAQSAAQNEDNEADEERIKLIV
jgi:phenylpropionate dioxygenase-like ring-hydroxylating dioxygenase large terminal subunit